MPCKAMNQFNKQVLLELLIMFVVRALVICFFSCKQVYNSSYCACRLPCFHFFSCPFFLNKKEQF